MLHNPTETPISLSWRLGKVAILVVGMVFMLASFENWSWNQRLVLEVETPRGVVSGGSVVRIKVGSSPKWAPGQGAGGMGGSVSEGEASFVEIAPGRYLFALLDDGTEQIPYYTFFRPDDQDRPRQATELEAMRATGVVPRDRYPPLVTFADINDPTSVQKVDPDNLAATFGPGVSLRRVTLTITDEGMTEGGVKNVLNWLGQHPEPKLGPTTGGTKNIPFYRVVSHGNFLRQ